MAKVVRVALPGYNALTDTNLDHFSLYSDIDNVLIKRFATGQQTIADGSPTILTIPHNLGYIPFFIVHFYDEVNSCWSILNNQANLFSTPQQIAAVDTQNLYIYNYGGHGSGSLQVVYDIFYDNMNDNTAPQLNESKSVFKIARPGINARQSRNPNDYIFHSDLNNFKILSEGIGSGDIANTSSISFAHGAIVQAPYKYLLFVKYKDGVTILMSGNATVKSKNEATTFHGSEMTATNIILTYALQGGIPSPLTVKWYIYGSGVADTVPRNKTIVSVAKPGFNVLTERNPDNFNFHSAFNTLKYYLSDTYSMTVSNTTVQTIPHNLGYVPFFIAFVNDVAGGISNGYALAPYYLGQSSIPSPSRDIAAWAYADATNIYLKAWYQANAVGTVKTFNWYYKIFKNNLGL